jgi:2-C-methyl-D-erythritol 4-phosphate cytidylyltransferase
MGFLVAGPAGSAVGAILGTGVVHTLKNIGEDVAKRFLSTREKRLLAHTIEGIVNQINAK